jgi:hypothetical protein
LKNKAEVAIKELSEEIELLSSEIRDVCHENDNLKSKIAVETKEKKLLSDKVAEAAKERDQSALYTEGLRIKLEGMTIKANQLESFLAEHQRRGDVEQQLREAEASKWEMAVELERCRSELQWRITAESDYRLHISTLENELGVLRGKRWEIENKYINLQQYSETCTTEVQNKTRLIEVLQSRYIGLQRLMQSKGVDVPSVLDHHHHPSGLKSPKGLHNSPPPPSLHGGGNSTLAIRTDHHSKFNSLRGIGSPINKSPPAGGARPATHRVSNNNSSGSNNGTGNKASSSSPPRRPQPPPPSSAASPAREIKRKRVAVK